VIIPVKDGARYLGEVLDAIAGQDFDGEVETLVVDSGSTDGSLEIARSAPVELVVISPSDFGHGKTRNRMAERSSGEYLVFVTQDATPADERWLAHLVEPIVSNERVGLSFGPHLARPDTTPMVARELAEFFRSFSPDDSVRVDCTLDGSDPANGFFSNVNSCVARACWEEIQFRDVPYSEDQAFARDALERGWCKAFAPSAAVLHAHDYPLGRFMRRYFDEYRGLRETTGHVEPFSVGRTARTTLGQVRGDLGYMRAAGIGRGGRVGWGVRSALHHSGRSLFASLGSRSDRLPAQVRARLSLEGREGGAGARPASGGRLIRATPRYQHEYIRRHAGGRPAPLAPPSPHDGSERPLHIAWLIPPFRRGSGGHMTIFTLMRELEARGHSCSIWIHDPGGLMDRRAALAHREINEHFMPLNAGVFRDFEDWHGADVALATGWQTAYPLDGLPGCKLKAYLVQDYEPDFFAASSERLWAEQTYRLGYPCIAASTWLRDLMRERYGAKAEAFDLGVDFDTYGPRGLPRDDETVIFYARPATPRRATELGMLAIAELLSRRPAVRPLLFGDVKPPAAPFDYRFAGVVDQRTLAVLYNTATVGLVISLTNYSRTPKEMMACRLPVVDVRHPSVQSVFGPPGEVIEQADLDPISIADRLEGLLADRDRRERLASAGQDFVQGMSWTAAAATIERSLRTWLRERWEQEAGSRTAVPA